MKIFLFICLKIKKYFTKAIVAEKIAKKFLQKKFFCLKYKKFFDILDYEPTTVS